MAMPHQQFRTCHPSRGSKSRQSDQRHVPAGCGKQKIADYLNQDGITNRGRKWTAFAIDYILNNERYVGDALLQKHITTNEWPPRKILNDGSRPQYYVENALRRSGPERNARRFSLWKLPKKYRYNRGGHALSRMLVCGECGHTFRRIKRKSGIVWGCAYSTSAGRNAAESLCGNRCVRRFSPMRQHALLSQRRNLLPLITRMETLQSKRNGTQVKIWEIDQQIASLSKQSLVIADLLASGILETVILPHKATRSAIRSTPCAHSADIAETE